MSYLPYPCHARPAVRAHARLLRPARPRPPRVLLRPSGHPGPSLGLGGPTHGPRPVHALRSRRHPVPTRRLLPGVLARVGVGVGDGVAAGGRRCGADAGRPGVAAAAAAGAGGCGAGGDWARAGGGGAAGGEAGQDAPAGGRWWWKWCSGGADSSMYGQHGRGGQCGVRCTGAGSGELGVCTVGRGGVPESWLNTGAQSVARRPEAFGRNGALEHVTARCRLHPVTPN